tara:strand:+ start:34 stop:1050 length:1017 start_codon:yes stop_codon:yes gene_type:complete
MAEKPILQKVGSQLDKHFGVSKNYQNARFKSGLTADGKPFKNENGVTNLNRYNYLKEVNQWIKNNPKTWKDIRANSKFPFSVLQEKLTPTLGIAYWGIGDKRGQVVPLGKGDTFTLHNVTANTAHAKSDIERRGNRGSTSRKNATVNYTANDFIDWGKRNGHSTAKSIQVYKEFEAKKKAQMQSGTSKTHNDHTQPHKSLYLNPGETPRNKLHIDRSLNLKKSDKMMTINEMKKAGIPTSKAGVIAAEFNKKPITPESVRQQITTNIANDPNRPTARQNNIRLNQAQQRRTNMMKLGGFGPLNTSTKGFDNMSLADIVKGIDSQTKRTPSGGPPIVTF